jgi:hypothetical protein
MMAALQSTSRAGEAPAALRWLAARPVCLLAVLLALNGVVRPYAGFWHDARLYSAQVLNRADPGCYADDLFFRYGSQDELSIFSRLAAPLASCFGIEVTFFGLFLVLNALFLFALQRFVLALIEDRATAVLALVFLAVAPLPFSGLNILQVHEAFLTPRPLANALVLFGLERLLRRHYLTALGLCVLAVPVHPIMALAGLLVWLTYVVMTLLPPRAVVAALASTVLLAIGVLAWEPLGARLFGTMDAEWREMVRAATIFNFPLEWNVSDWLNQGVSFAVALAAARWLRALDAGRRRFALSIALVGAAGLAGTFLGSLGPYALLFQSQPARVLWLLKIGQVAFGFALIAQWSRSPDWLPRLAALGLGLFFCVTTYMGAEFFVLALAWPFCCLAYRGVNAAPRHADWSWRAAATSLAIGVALWAAYKCGLLLYFLDRILPKVAPHEIYQLLILNLGPVVILMLFVLAVRRLRGHDWLTARRLAGGCLVIALAAHSALFAANTLPSYRAHATRYGADLAQVREYLARHRAPGAAPPTVYCSLGYVNYLWVDCRSKSYFDWNQIVGVMFQRQTALESRRRALLVRAFEMARVREDAEFLSRDAQRSLRLLFETDFDHPAPSVLDVRRLCQEPGLDFLVLKQDFPGLAPTATGQLFIYDCRQVRAALGLPEPNPVSAVAAIPSGLLSR